MRDGSFATPTKLHKAPEQHRSKMPDGQLTAEREKNVNFMWIFIFALSACLCMFESVARIASHLFADV